MNRLRELLAIAAAAKPASVIAAEKNVVESRNRRADAAANLRSLGICECEIDDHLAEYDRDIRGSLADLTWKRQEFAPRFNEIFMPLMAEAAETLVAAIQNLETASKNVDAILSAAAREGISLPPKFRQLSGRQILDLTRTRQAATRFLAMHLKRRSEV